MFYYIHVPTNLTLSLLTGSVLVRVFPSSVIDRGLNLLGLFYGV